jgi:outer membrane protein assembly factor BamB
MVRDYRRFFHHLVVVVFLSLFLSLSINVYPQLHIVYEGVGAGAITAPPIEIPGRGDGEVRSVVVLATEDRRLRLLDSDGSVTGEYRTGIRYPLSLEVVWSGGVDTDTPRSGSGGTAILRIIADDGSAAVTSVYGGQLRGVSIIPPTPPGRHSGSRWKFDDSVVATHVDPTGNTLVFSSPAVVTYISTTGYVLWSRSLPAAVMSSVADDSGVYVGLADGRIFVFSGHGEGRLVARLGAAVSDIAMRTDRGDPYVAALTNDGRITRLDEDGAELSVVWATDLRPRIDGGEGRFVRPDTSGGIALFQRRGAIVSLDHEGNENWIVDIPGGGFEDVVALPGDDLLVGITTDRRIISIDAAGATVDVAGLSAVTMRVTPLPIQRRVFVEYPNWRYEVVQVEAEPTTPPPPRSTAATTGRLYTGRNSGLREESPSAFIRLAEATLASSSQRDRNTLLDTIERRIDDRDLFGRVDDVVDVLTRLAQESYGGPRIVGGVVQNNFPEVRTRAATLLGYFGGNESRHALATIVRYDPDVDVVAAALRVAGNAGFDDAGVAEWGTNGFVPPR